MPRRIGLLTFLFATALFVSAALLFWVEPMIAKMLLPLLGGTPAVWNTCILFFQVMLLAGYVYVFVVTSRLGGRGQTFVHAGLLIVAAFFFPFEISERALRSLGGETSPVGWLLASLLRMVGLPFFVVSTSGPLLQKWFSLTRDPSARDPYFLYAASNAGSLLALLGYPLLLEPTFTLREQSWLWVAVYGVLVVLTVSCAFAVWRARLSKADGDVTASDDAETSGDEQAGGGGAEEGLLPEMGTLRDAGALRRRLVWVALAFVPSSLMLGVTTYVSTDIAAIPLLWVVPLAIYLLTLILVFARREVVPRRLMNRVLPGAAVILVLVYLSGATQPVWFLVVVHLFFFFVAAMVCHGRLADDRPSARHLPEFYLWMAIGGALGGFFNAIVAPVAFNTVVEYPLAIVLACLLQPSAAAVAATDDERVRARRFDFAIPVGLGVLAIVLALVVSRFNFESLEQTAIVFGIPLMLAYLTAVRPARFAFALVAIILGSTFFTGAAGRTLHVERNFFGVLRVADSADGATRLLYHGSTLHGRQFIDASRRCEPLSYYHRNGPLGAVFGAFDTTGAAATATRRVAVIGLGTGATAAYAKPGEAWTFYEINPAVLDIARDAKYFSYLQDCAGSPVEVVLGDARLQLRAAPSNHFGLIVLDAFSSDAIPVHLMTRESLDLYLSKLAEGGVIAFHISNRSLDLHPVVGDLARDKGLVCLSFDDLQPDAAGGKEPSQWVVMARRAEHLGALAFDMRWKRLEGRAGREVWTDDFSNIVGVFKWQ